MPNSINKPRHKLHARSHAQALGNKRAVRAKTAAATASSTSRYNTDLTTSVKPTESKAVALYIGKTTEAPATITTHTLSKKRAKKIARNQKYIDERNSRLNIDLAAQQELMDVDAAPKPKKEVKETETGQVRTALWAVVAARASEGLKLDTSGEGTTLGVQAF